MATQTELIQNQVRLSDENGNDVDIIKNVRSGRFSLVVNSDISQCTFSEEYTSDQTNLIIITPEIGKKLFIHSVYCTTEGASGEVHLDFLTSGKIVFRMYVTKESATAVANSNIVGEINEPLTLNTNVGNNDIFVLINYICE